MRDALEETAKGLVFAMSDEHHEVNLSMMGMTTVTATVLLAS